jgi:hypothetical protein
MLLLLLLPGQLSEKGSVRSAEAVKKTLLLPCSWPERSIDAAAARDAYHCIFVQWTPLVASTDGYPMCCRSSCAAVVQVGH